MPHALVTLAIPFEDKDADKVEAALDRMGNPATVVIKEPLDADGVVHFMSITAVRGESGKNAHLVFEINADGAVPTVIASISAVIGEPIGMLLEVAGVSLGTRTLYEFLTAHRLKTGQGIFDQPGIDFDGTAGMTVKRIKEEAGLAARIGSMVDRFTRSQHPSAMAILEAVRRELWNDAAAKWAFVPEATPMLEAAPSAWNAVLPVSVSFVVALLWPFLLVPLALFAVGWAFGSFATALIVSFTVLAAEIGAAYAWLRRLEAADVPDDEPPNATAVAAILRHENFAVQNHMAAVSVMKPGLFRRLTLRIGLWVAGQLALHFSRPGFLSSTSVIHFARWMLLPGTNQLLFRSNFDGTWEAYLEDFIEKAQLGVTGIWSNTAGFPKTSNLFLKGAADGDRLRRWTRRQQLPSLCWYTAYPSLTLDRIRTNAAIREGVASAATEADARDWLACFGSAPRPAATIQFSSVPTLVLGGLSRLRYGAVALLRLSDEVTANKSWLSSIDGKISYGDQLGALKALVAGFSASGLRKLGLTESDIVTFPVNFQQGMSMPSRARLLGDTGPDDPSRWIWGGANAWPDAVLLIYAADAADLARELGDEIDRLAAFGASVLHQIRFAPLPPGNAPTVEPFGFVDGISQPIIRGTVRATRTPNSHQLVAPGEFILGYPDNLGYIPSTPSVTVTQDSGELLDNIGGDPSRQRPDFAEPLPNTRHDLGCNGTYLVVRQLEQDVAGFNAFLDAAAREHSDDSRVPRAGGPLLREWIAAKMVGRWRDGTSLVRHPNAPASSVGRDPSPDNEFLFGEDPTGVRCPFGAHIRRGNPRDSFEPGSAQQLAITNRHRILRVGRRYADEDGKEGIVFMCLNTDIERQFEFVQRTWVLSPSFSGLENESDPLLGFGKGANVITIPTPGGPLRLNGLKDFVTVRGGAYFFLPGKEAVRFLVRR